MKTRGHCLCGAVTFEADGVETEVHVCHCGICRQWTGGPAFAVRAGSVKFDGEEAISRYDSSEWAERGFCKRCGSHLFYRLKEADQYVLWPGVLDTIDGFHLASEIFIDEKVPYYDLAGDHPRLTGEQFMASIQKE